MSLHWTKLEHFIQSSTYYFGEHKLNDEHAKLGRTQRLGFKDWGQSPIFSN